MKKSVIVVWILVVCFVTYIQGGTFTENKAEKFGELNLTQYDITTDMEINNGRLIVTLEKYDTSKYNPNKRKDMFKILGFCIGAGISVDNQYKGNCEVISLKTNSNRYGDILVSIPKARKCIQKKTQEEIGLCLVNLINIEDKTRQRDSLEKNKKNEKIVKNKWKDRIDPGDLKKGKIYKISKETPLMPTYTTKGKSFDETMELISKQINLPKNSTVKIVKIKQNTGPWYKVTAKTPEGIKADGWINSSALTGQDINIYKEKESNQKSSKNHTEQREDINKKALEYNKKGWLKLNQPSPDNLLWKKTKKFVRGHLKRKKSASKVTFSNKNPEVTKIMTGDGKTKQKLWEVRSPVSYVNEKGKSIKLFILTIVLSNQNWEKVDLTFLE